MDAGATVRAAKVDAAKRDAGFKATVGIGAAGGTLGAKLTIGLTDTIGVYGRDQTLHVFLFE